MTIRWITENLGTGPAASLGNESDATVIDVRDLVDKSGNPLDAVREKIFQGVASLQQGSRTIVCCDYGISRSNAIAVGILALFEQLPFEAAVRRVLDATGEHDIKLEPLLVVRNVVDQSEDDKPDGTRRILVTGGNGFLGRPLVQALEKDYIVFSPSSKEVDIQKGNTFLNLILEGKGIDCIVHLANPRVYTSNIAMGTTLTMLRNVLEVCVAHEISLVYLSSWEVYSGYRTNYLLADESLPLFPKGPYAETKYLCELMIDHFQRTRNLHCTILRPSPVFGPSGSKPKFVYNFIEKIRRSESVITHLYINGRPALDLIYIDDIVDAIVKAVTVGYSGTLNLGSGVVTSTRNVAEILMTLVGNRVEISETPIEGDTACIAMDSRKAAKLLNWRTSVTLEQGLQKIVSECCE